MSFKSSDFLDDILNELNYLLTVKSSLKSFSEFENDETLKRAVCRSFEIIGEATKNLPEETRTNNPEIPWKEMAGLRDFLIHSYGDVDYGKIFEFVVDEVSDLKNKIEILNNKLNNG